VVVDAIAPDFTLKDEDGRNIPLNDFRKGKKLILAFIRGVDDSKTRKLLDYLKDDCERFKYHGAEVLAISYGSVDFNKTLHRTLRLPFHILSDPDCRTIKLYGLYNQYDKLIGPAIFVLNQAGTVMFMYLGKNPEDMVENEEIIRVLEGDTQARPEWPRQG